MMTNRKKWILIIGVISAILMTNMVFASNTGKLEQTNFDKQISNIDILSFPTRLFYTQGDTFDLRGLRLFVDYDDISSETIRYNDERISYEGFDSSKGGSQEVRIYFTNNLDKELITILPVEIKEGDRGTNVKNVDTKSKLMNLKGNIEGDSQSSEYYDFFDIVQYPNKVAYQEGEEIDYSGLKIEIYPRSNALYQSLPPEYIEYNEETKDDFSFIIEEETDSILYVMVTYKNVQADFYLEIYKKPNDDKIAIGCSLIQKPNKRIYLQGESIDLTGGIIEIQYDDRTSQIFDMTQYNFENIKINSNSYELIISSKYNVSVWMSVEFINNKKLLLDSSQEPLASPKVIEIDKENLNEYTNKLYDTNNLQSEYLLREYIDIPTANQSPYGLCNLFAYTKSMETNNHLTNGMQYDLSERYVDYMSTTDFFGYSRKANANSAMGESDMAKIFSLYGVALEEDIPYIDYTNDEYEEIKEAKTYVKAGQLIEFPNCENYTDEEYEKIKDMIKSHVMKYGTVKITVNGERGTKYYQWYSSANHAISVVGWDDNYSKTNFNPQPEHDGAWIALNSWGDSFGDHGLVYVSYDDVNSKNRSKGIISTIESENYLDSISNFDLWRRYDIKSFNMSNRMILTNEFQVEGNSNYISSIIFPEKIKGYYDSEVKVYIVNDWNGTNFNNYEYVGNLVKSSFDINGLYFKEPYEIKGNKILIILECPRNTSFSGYEDETIDAKYIDLRTYGFNNPCTMSYEIPMMIELTNGNELGKKVESITIKKEPVKKEYNIHEGIDLTGGVLEVTLRNGTKEEISTVEDGVYAYGYTSNNDCTSDIPITIVYGGMKATYNIDVRKDVSKIEIKDLPEILEHLDRSVSSLLYDGTIFVTYSDGTTQEIRMDFGEINVTINGEQVTAKEIDWSNYDIGTYTVTIEYQGKKDTFEIEVISDVVSATVLHMPDKTVYRDGDFFDDTGLEIEIEYSNGQKIIMTSVDELIEQFKSYFIVLRTNKKDSSYYGSTDTLMEGTYALCYRFNYGDLLIPIEVLERIRVEGITIKKLPNRTTFDTSEITSLIEGGIVQVSYTDGSTLDVNMESSKLYFWIDDVFEGSLNNYRVGKLESGEHTVIVQFGTERTSFKITVVKVPVIIHSIEIWDPPINSFDVKDTASLIEGGTIYVIFSDYSSEVIDMSEQGVELYFLSGDKIENPSCVDFSTMGVGEWIIEVRYEGKSTTFTIEVTKKIDYFKTRGELVYEEYQNGEEINLEGIEAKVFYTDGSYITFVFNNETYDYGAFTQLFKLVLLDENHEIIDDDFKGVFNEEGTFILATTVLTDEENGLLKELGTIHVTKQKEIVSIEMESLPDERVFLLNDEFSLLGNYSIRVNYSNNSSEIIPLDAEEVEIFIRDNTFEEFGDYLFEDLVPEPGTYGIGVIYHNNITSFTIEIRDFIERFVFREPARYYYEVYQNIDLSSGRLTIYYYTGDRVKIYLDEEEFNEMFYLEVLHDDELVEDFDGFFQSEGVYTIRIIERGKEYEEDFNPSFDIEVVPYRNRVLVPELVEQRLEYTGEQITPEILGIDNQIMELTGDMQGTEVGGYWIDVRLKDIRENVWYYGEDEYGELLGDDEYATLYWKIIQAEPEIEILNRNQTEKEIEPLSVEITPKPTNGQLKILYSNKNGSGYTENMPTEAGLYKVKISLNGDNNLLDKEVNEFLLIEKGKEMTAIPIPTLSNDTFVYNGAEQTLNFEGVFNSLVEISGDKNTNVGKYEAVIKLKDLENYRWTDGTQEAKKYEWKIEQSDWMYKTDNLKQKINSITPLVIEIQPEITDGILKVLYVQNGEEIEEMPTKEGTYIVKIEVSGDKNLINGVKEEELVIEKVSRSSSSGASSSAKTYKTTIKQTKGGIVEIDKEKVKRGENQVLTIEPLKDYVIEKVLIDGINVGAVETYTLEDVTKNHTVTALFEKQDEKTEIEHIPEKPFNYKFNDVTLADWYYEAVKYVVENGLFKGISETKFAPNQTMNRAMVVTVLYRLAGEEKVKGNIPFIDVDSNSYYYEAVIWAYDNKIITGTTDELFSPDEYLTREQIVTILHRYAKQMKKDVSVSFNKLPTYKDNNDIAEYALDAFNWAIEKEIMTGRTENTLMPKETATRAEVATILMRFESLIK